MARDPYGKRSRPTPKESPAVEDGVETKVKCPVCAQGLVSVEVHVAFVDWCRERQAKA